MLYSGPSFAQPATASSFTYKRNPIMTINAILQARANAKCELCGAEHALTAFPVPHSPPATTTTAWPLRHLPRPAGAAGHHGGEPLALPG